MNILYDFYLVGPESGGVGTICYSFARHVLRHFSDNVYHAITSPFMNGPLSRLADAESAVALLDRVSAERCAAQTSDCSQVSLLRRFYRRSPVMSPARAIWRSLVSPRSGVARALQARKMARARVVFRENCRTAEIDVIHCPFQWIRPLPPRQPARIAYIMNLHDLQHEHFPQFFTDEQIEYRRRVWYASARASRFVVAGTTCIRDDIVKYTGVSPDKVPVIPMGPMSAGYEEPAQAYLANVKQEHRLPDRFIYYPAIMWEHKNHIGLLNAVVLLREKGQDVNVVFTGGPGPYEEKVRAFVDANGLADQVRHLGFVSYKEVTALYKLATAAVSPSLHEQTSGPFIEAMCLGCPTAAGDIADHAELAADDCGLLFDPADSEDIARCVEILWTQPDRTHAMATNAERRIHLIRSWRSWARGYNELYNICAEEKSVGGHESGVRREA